MSRRKTTPWAAPFLPDIRRQWCNALDSLVGHQSTALAEPSQALGAAGESLRRLHRLQAKLTETLSHMSGEADVIKGTELY